MKAVVVWKEFWCCCKLV